MAGGDGKSRFLETLIEARDNSRTVAVYSDDDDFQNYEVGFVEHADISETVLCCLTPKGEPDGKRVIRTSDIVRLDYDNNYTRRLELLFQYRSSIFNPEFTKAASERTDLRGQLEGAMESRTVVHLVDANDYGPTGFITHIGEDYVEMQRLAASGEPDGKTTLMMENVAKVHISRRQEQVIEFLYRYNYELKKLLGS